MSLPQQTKQQWHKKINYLQDSCPEEQEAEEEESDPEKSAT